MQNLRERLLQRLTTGEGVNRRLVLLVGLGVAAISAVLMAINTAKPLPAQVTSTVPSVVAKLPDVYVHVAGEVLQPGVYSLQSDSRVFDAIFAAGGFTKQAEQSSINLARSISDGEQIIVLAKGASIVGQSNSVSAMVSLNRASQNELETLPGVGPTLAARLIDWRTTNGGFKRLEDLRKVSGIGAKLFARIKAKATL